MSSKKATSIFDTLPLVTLIMSVLSIVLIMVAFYLWRAEDTEVPEPVVNFLDEFLTEGYSTEQGLYLFPRYFVELKDVDTSDTLSIADNFSVEQDLFEQVFYGKGAEYKGYELEPVTHDFAKVTPVRVDGTRDYPSVGLWYTVKHYRIDSWRIARLSPFSVYDVEYSEEWDEP